MRGIIALSGVFLRTNIKISQVSHGHPIVSETPTKKPSWWPAAAAKSRKDHQRATEGASEGASERASDRAIESKKAMHLLAVPSTASTTTQSCRGGEGGQGEDSRQNRCYDRWLLAGTLMIMVCCLRRRAMCTRGGRDMKHGHYETCHSVTFYFMSKLIFFILASGVLYQI